MISFYMSNEATMKQGFDKILRRYGENQISDINELSQLLDYIDYIGSSNFTEHITKTFSFIGLVSVRQVRTKSKVCDTRGRRKDKTCYYDTYSTDTRDTNPIIFLSASGVGQDYLEFKTSLQNKVTSQSTGKYSTYDGSGYTITFNHENITQLADQAVRFEAMKDNYLRENTRAVIINYNLHYPVSNVNISTEVVSSRLMARCSKLGH